MRSLAELGRTLLDLDGLGYKAYKRIAGAYLDLECRGIDEASDAAVAEGDNQQSEAGDRGGEGVEIHA